MPRGEYDKVHKKHHDKIMADAKKEYYALPREMRQEVMRLHRALAQIPRLDIARGLKDAGAKEEIVMWTKRHFRCPVCDSKVKPGAQRLSSAKRVWEFNKVVGLDHIHPKFQALRTIFSTCYAGALQGKWWYMQKPVQQQLVREDVWQCIGCNLLD